MPRLPAFRHWEVTDTVTNKGISLFPGMIISCALVVLSAMGRAQDITAAQDVAEGSTAEAKAPDIAAVVDNVPIFVADVDLRVRQALGGREATDEALALLEAEALGQLVRQEKVLVQLRRRGEACTQQELKVELRRLNDQLTRQEKTLDDYCRALEISQTSLRRRFEWQLSWKRCRDKYLTDENLQRHFDRHQREFDGTTIRVAQILLKPSTRSERQRLVQRAEEIRQEITSGGITFADAARKYSQAPSAESGGELGWIQRHAPMPEFFSHVAYQLEVNDMSQPVESPYGVHLIRCLEIKPGQKDWRDVREPLRNAVSEYLFDWLANRPEPKHDVRYTGKTPHFRPGTRELADVRDGEAQARKQ